MNRFESALIKELHEMNRYLKAINCTLSLLTVAITSEDENENIKDWNAESDNQI